MGLFIDLHAVQTLPPANINRDGNGRPKTCVYGGRQRMRVSSQAWKKAIRDEFGRTLDPSRLGERSRMFTHMVADRTGLGPDDEKLLDVTDILMRKLNLPADKQMPGNTSAMQFFGNPQWDLIATVAKEAYDADDPGAIVDDHVKELRATLDADTSIDVALFGRMSASDDKKKPTLYLTDAACQFAHAIGVTETHVEDDYFTAVDDHPDASGAGMVGDQGFQSATVYRYACVDVNLLNANLAGDRDATTLALANLIHAYAVSMPGGKRNAFAPNTLPAAILAQVRHDRPLNLVEAFEQPVKGDTIPNTVRALLGQLDTYTTQYGLESPTLWAMADRNAAQALDTTLESGIPIRQSNLPDLIDMVTSRTVKDL